MALQLPRELIDEIIGIVAIRERNTKMQDLQSFSLTARPWTIACQRHILQAITIPSLDRLLDWTSEIKINPEGGVSSCVQTLTLRGENPPTRPFSPNTLKPHLAAFVNLECLILSKFHIHSHIEHAKRILECFGLFKGKLKTLHLESCSLSPNAFQSILYLFPLLNDVFISDDCLAETQTEDDITLKPPLMDGTNFGGKLATGSKTLQAFLPCFLTVPLRFSSLVCLFNPEGYQLISACASTLQELSFEDTITEDIEVNQIFFPELRTLKLWIEVWGDVGSMINHQFPLIESAPNLSMIHIEVNEETNDTDILSDSSGWDQVEHQLCRLAEGTSGLTLLLETTSSEEWSDKASEIVSRLQFLPEFQKAGGTVQIK